VVLVPRAAVDFSGDEPRVNPPIPGLALSDCNAEVCVTTHGPSPGARLQRAAP
jgi:hypothetical protein